MTLTTSWPLRQTIHELFGPTRPIDDDVAIRAAKLRLTSPALRLRDALVVATGIVDDAGLVLTADKRLVGADRRVQLLD